MQGPERRSNLERAFGTTVDRMAARAIGPRIGFAALFGARCSERGGDQKQPNQGVAQRLLQHGNWFPLNSRSRIGRGRASKLIWVNRLWRDAVKCTLRVGLRQVQDPRWRWGAMDEDSGN